MGCSIRVCAERETKNGFEFVPGSYLEYRNYGLFGWLADVRNYSAVPPIAKQRGIPNDASALTRETLKEYEIFSWLLVSELTNFDFDQIMEDRRTWIKNSYSGTLKKGNGKLMTYRQFLGPWVLQEIERLRVDGVDRIVFAFIN